MFLRTPLESATAAIRSQSLSITLSSTAWQCSLRLASILTGRRAAWWVGIFVRCLRYSSAKRLLEKLVCRVQTLLHLEHEPCLSNLGGVTVAPKKRWSRAPRSSSLVFAASGVSVGLCVIQSPLVVVVYFELTVIAVLYRTCSRWSMAKSAVLSVR